MSGSSNAKIMYEGGASYKTIAALTTSDYTVFKYTGVSYYSMEAGKTPDVRPSGVITGCQASIHASNDTISIAAGTHYVKGVLTTFTADTITFTRGTDEKAKVNWATIGSDNALAVVAGLIGTGLTFSDTYAAAGGPPLIPVYSNGIAWIRTTANAAAPLVASEIHQVDGISFERAGYPGYTVNPTGDGQYATNAGKTTAHIVFDTDLELSHAGPTCKSIWMGCYEPVLIEHADTQDFVPAEQTVSSSSTQVHGNKTKGLTTLGQGVASYKAIMTNAVTDSFMSRRGKTTMFKYFPDREDDPYSLTSGMVGIATQNPVAGHIVASVTISSDNPTVTFAA